MRHRILVPLATDPNSLREVDASPAGDGQFRLVGVAHSNERMRFQRGEIVECEIRALPNGSKGLVAVRSVSADPEFKKRRNMFATFGAIVGGIVGVVVALFIEATPTSAAVGFLTGAVIFAFSSVRWGDDAWVVLSRFIRWM